MSTQIKSRQNLGGFTSNQNAHNKHAQRAAKRRGGTAYTSFRQPLAWALAVRVSMKAIFKSTEGEYLEAVLEVSGQAITVMDDFGGPECFRGQEMDVELRVGLEHECESQNEMLDGNPERIKKLEPLGGWAYRAYGIISNVEDETLVDVGVCEINAPFEGGLVGESIAFTVERLDAHSS